MHVLDVPRTLDFNTMIKYRHRHQLTIESLSGIYMSLLFSIIQIWNISGKPQSWNQTNVIFMFVANQRF